MSSLMEEARLLWQAGNQVEAKAKLEEALRRYPTHRLAPLAAFYLHGVLRFPLYEEQKPEKDEKYRPSASANQDARITTIPSALAVGCEVNGTRPGQRLG